MEQEEEAKEAGVDEIHTTAAMKDTDCVIQQTLWITSQQDVTLAVS